VGSRTREDVGDTERDTSRTVVQTYVPAYQREEWDEHAEQLGMSRSEFVRSMVQAGRRGFGADPDPAGEETNEVTAGSLDERVREELSASGPLSWEELLAALTGDIESRLEESLKRLQSEDVRYSGRRGGYVLTDGESE
jgi:hypothetical protein